MSEKICKCGCGEPLKAGSPWSYKRGHKPKSGQKPAGGGNARNASSGNGRVKKNGAVTITATNELCDGIWRSLTLERKAELLNKLAED